MVSVCGKEAKEFTKYLEKASKQRAKLYANTCKKLSDGTLQKDEKCIKDVFKKYRKQNPLLIKKVKKSSKAYGKCLQRDVKAKGCIKDQMDGIKVIDEYVLYTSKKMTKACPHKKGMDSDVHDNCIIEFLKKHKKDKKAKELNRKIIKLGKAYDECMKGKGKVGKK